MPDRTLRAVDHAHRPLNASHAGGEGAALLDRLDVHLGDPKERDLPNDPGQREVRVQAHLVEVVAHVRVFEHLERQHVLGANQIGDIGLERREPTLVPGDLRAVEPHPRPAVNPIEAHHHPSGPLAPLAGRGVGVRGPEGNRRRSREPNPVPATPAGRAEPGHLPMRGHGDGRPLAVVESGPLEPRRRIEGKAPALAQLDAPQGEVHGRQGTLKAACCELLRNAPRRFRPNGAPQADRHWREEHPVLIRLHHPMPTPRSEGAGQGDDLPRRGLRAKRVAEHSHEVAAQVRGEMDFGAVAFRGPIHLDLGEARAVRDVGDAHARRAASGLDLAQHEPGQADVGLAVVPGPDPALGCVVPRLDVPLEGEARELPHQHLCDIHGLLPLELEPDPAVVAGDPRPPRVGPAVVRQMSRQTRLKLRGGAPRAPCKISALRHRSRCHQQQDPDKHEGQRSNHGGIVLPNASVHAAVRQESATRSPIW